MHRFTKYRSIKCEKLSNCRSLHSVTSTTLKYSHVQLFPHHRTSWCLANGCVPSPPRDPYWLTIVSHTTRTLFAVKGWDIPVDTRGHRCRVRRPRLCVLTQCFSVMYRWGMRTMSPCFPPGGTDSAVWQRFPSSSNGYSTTFSHE